MREQLTANFYLDEFTLSQTAARHGIDMEPPADVVENLRRLCVDVLQPLRDELGKSIVITSGYRPPLLNERIGGSATSQHPRGEAADIRAIGATPIEVAVAANNLNLPFHQLIHEFRSWVHISVAPAGAEPKLQLLTADRVDGKTQYQTGLHA